MAQSQNYQYADVLIKGLRKGEFGLLLSFLDGASRNNGISPTRRMGGFIPSAASILEKSGFL
jgi:hypothetical protein